MSGEGLLKGDTVHFVSELADLLVFGNRWQGLASLWFAVVLVVRLAARSRLAVRSRRVDGRFVEGLAFDCWRGFVERVLGLLRHQLFHEGGKVDAFFLHQFFLHRGRNGQRLHEGTRLNSSTMRTRRQSGAQKQTTFSNVKDSPYSLTISLSFHVPKRIIWMEERMVPMFCLKQTIRV